MTTDIPTINIPVENLKDPEAETTSNPLVAETSRHVPIWQWALIIFSIILIIVFILWGRQFIQKEYGWGTWSDIKTSKCTSSSMSCSQPATQWKFQTCEPNALTRRGCLNYDGVQTYATRQKQVDCKLQCQMSKWDIDVSVCQASDPCTPVVTGGVMGSQVITYTCIPFDETGINACTTGGLVNFNNGQYQAVKVYQPGDVINTTVPCMTTCPVTSLAPKTIESLIYSNNLDTSFRLIPNCITQNNLELEEGFELIEHTPSLNSEDLVKITPSQIQQGQLPESVLDKPYIQYDDQVYHINLCRLMKSSEFYHLKMRKGWLSGLQTPNNCSTILKYKIWNHQPTNYLYDTPLTWSNKSELKIVLIIVPISKINRRESLARISITINNVYAGWLIIKNNLPYWAQAQIDYTGPGKTSNEVDLIRIRQIKNEITFLNTDGTELIIPSADAWLDRKSWNQEERMTFTGSLYQIS